MWTAQRSLQQIASIFVAALVAGCGVGYLSVKPTSPLDRQRLSTLVPGVSTFSEVLTQFGPPDAIVDGTKQFKPAPSGSVLATRVINAPDGMVILIYADASGYGATLNAANVVGVKNDIVANEVFIYVSKTTLKVVEVVLPRDRR